MRAGFSVLASALVLTGCSPPHQFDIISDEPIANVEVKLANLRESKVRLVSAHHALVEAYTADSSGEIRVQLVTGGEVSCRIGYITNGEPEPHQLVIRDKHCNGV
jgi:hypothetical protein